MFRYNALNIIFKLFSTSYKIHHNKSLRRYTIQNILLVNYPTLSKNNINARDTYYFINF